MVAPAKSAVFQPVQKLQGLEKFPEAERSLIAQLNAIRLDMGKALGRPTATELKTVSYLAREEEYVRAAPGSGGMTLQLPKATRQNLAARVTVLLESVSLADLTVQAIGGTVNAATTLTLGAVGRCDFISNGDTGWFSERHVAGSTSIVESGGEWQRAALTGAVAASQNSNATTFGAGAAGNGLSGDGTATLGNIGSTSRLVLSGSTGNLGTVDIGALLCGGSLFLSAVAGNWQIEGFTSKPAGYWFNLAAGNTAFTGTLLNEDATATAALRLRLSGFVDSAATLAMQAVICRNGDATSGLNRWSCVV